MCSDKPRLEVLNKIDLLSEEERAALTTAAGGSHRGLAPLEHIGTEALMERLDEELVQDPILEQRFQIPQSEGEVLGGARGRRGHPRTGSTKEIWCA